jgi:phosphoribosylanthranilate isomerase
MIKIKICGLKRVEDIKYVNELLPDYVGFVFAKSSRQVTLGEASKLIGLLDKNIKTVGVFKDEEIEKVKYAAGYLKLDIIQLHGNEDGEYIKKLSDFKVWKAAGIDSEAICMDEGTNRIYGYEAEGILLDSIVNGVKGGTGTSFSWDIINNLNSGKKIILAGGIDPENVENAIKKVRPYAVDVSSGVEEDGVKSYKKMKKFIEKARKII